MTIFIRTPRNLGEYNDDTHTGPGIVDQSQHETMTDLVARVLRGEIVTKNQMIYDFDENCKLSEEEQFASEDITQTDGFELSDAPVVLETIKNNLEKENDTSATKLEPKEDDEAPTQSNESDDQGSI